MPFNSSGLFERLFSWVADRNNGLKIRADRMDAEFNNFQTGLNDIVLGNAEMKGSIKGVSGSAENPAYAFADDPDSGLFRKPDGSIGVSIDGLEVGSFPASFFTGIANHLSATDDPHDIEASTIAAKLRTLTRSEAGVDADRIDGLHASSLLRSDTNDTYTGLISAERNSDEQLRLGRNVQRSPFLSFWRGTSRWGYIQALHDRFRINRDNGAQLDLLGHGDARINGQQIMHRGNHGHNSGFSSDLVDGLHASQFLRSDADDTASHRITFAAGATFGSNGGGDSAVLFYDDNSNTHRTLMWDDSVNDWRIEDNAGAMRSLWHGGNLDPTNFLGRNQTASDSNMLGGVAPSGYLHRNADNSVSVAVTFSEGISTDGKDVFLRNGALVFNDADGFSGDRQGSNIDHMWHEDDGNVWHFVSDGPYKSMGNALLSARGVTGSWVASRSEAEAGTNGDQIMTPLRVRQAVPRAIAAISAGAVGSHAFALNLSGTTLDYDDSVQGSALRPAGESDGDRRTQGLPLDGTWRCRGYAPPNFNTLFVKVA